MRKVKREVSSIVVRVSQKCSALYCEEQEKSTQGTRISSESRRLMKQEMVPQGVYLLPFGMTGMPSACGEVHKGIVTDEPHSDSQGLHCKVSRTVELTIVTANCEKSAEAVVGRGYSSLLESIPKAVALIGDVFFHYAVLHI